MNFCHLAFLGLIALYLAVFDPESRNCVVLVTFAGVLVEGLPRWFKNPLVPELLLLAAGLWSWWEGTALHGAIGIAAAYWLLIPCHVDRLKWVLALASLELLWLSREPGHQLAGLAAGAIGLTALGVDSWLKTSASERTGILFLRWALIPILWVIAGSVMLGNWVNQTTAELHSPPVVHNTEANIQIDFDGSLSIGDHASIPLDAQIAANLTWTSGSPPPGQFYLRAMATPDLVLKGFKLSWASTSRKLKPAATAALAPAFDTQLFRMPSRTNVVLRPDGCTLTDLKGVMVDDDGNLFAPHLGERRQTYALDSHPSQVPATPDSIQRCLQLDPQLDDLPWNRFEDRRWSRVTPEEATTLIAHRLQDLCHYDLENLPAPAQGPGGVLRGFLFGNSPLERRGHCQYFASAAAILLRRAGHPARCVSGYASDEIEGQTLIFRVLHAHAWVEFVNSQGFWQRFDPTPSFRNTRITQGVDLKAPEAAKKTVPPPKPPPRWIQPGWPALLFPLATLGLFWIKRYFSRPRTRPLNARLQQLQRRNEDLFELAASLGIPVKPSSTLTEVVRALEARCGVCLQSHLEAHLAARFGNGPLPDPWPPLKSL